MSTKKLREEAERAAAEAEAKRLSEMKIMSKVDRVKKQTELITKALQELDIIEEHDVHHDFLRWSNLDTSDMSSSNAEHHLHALTKKQFRVFSIYNDKAKWFDGFIERVKSLGYTVTIEAAFKYDTPGRHPVVDVTIE